MNAKLNALVILAMAGYSGSALTEAVTGKIVIDGNVYSSDSSVVIQGGKVIQGGGNVLQGSGNPITENRKLKAFDKLSINIAADIDFIASDRSRLELTADDNIAPTITAIIRGNTLVIDADQSFSSKSRIRVKVFGSASLRNILVDGSSDLNLKGIASDSLEINLDGTGDIVAQGSVTNLIINVDGSGDVHTKALRAENVSINVDGSSDVTVTAHNKLDVAIDGVSDVTYYGHPKSVNKNIDGVGEVSAGD